MWMFSLPPELPPLLVTRALRRAPLSHQEADRGMTGSDSGSHFSDRTLAECSTGLFLFSPVLPSSLRNLDAVQGKERDCRNEEA